MRAVQAALRFCGTLVLLLVSLKCSASVAELIENVVMDPSSAPFGFAPQNVQGEEVLPHAHAHNEWMGRGTQRRRLERHKHKSLVHQPTQLYYKIPSTSTGALPVAVAEALTQIEAKTDPKSGDSEAGFERMRKAALGSAQTALNSDTAPEDYYHNPEHFPMVDLVDIVVTVEKEDVRNGKVVFLEKWRPAIESLHCIIVLAHGVGVAASGAGAGAETQTNDASSSSSSDIKNLFPAWMSSYEVYTMADIAAAWGDKAYLAGASGLSLRNFAFWVSDRTVTYAIDSLSSPLALSSSGSDDSTQTATEASLKTTARTSSQQHYSPRSSHSKHDNEVNSREDHVQNQHSLLRRHMYNLFTPSTPAYFDVNYDSFLAGADYSKGYPYPLREGVHTGVSHGLSTGDVGYDRLTRLFKASEAGSRKRVSDVTLTIPRGSFFSMAHNNVAFNRRLIGAMFFYVPYTIVTAPATTSGSSRDGENEGVTEEYVDILSGWLVKTVSDAVGVGVKSGAPYVQREQPAAAAAAAVGPLTPETAAAPRLKEALQGSSNGTFLWQNELLSWLQDVQSRLDFGDTNGNVNKAAGCSARFFSPEFSDLNAAIDCAFLVLANSMETELAVSVSALRNVPRAMRDWLHIWHTRNTFIPSKHPKATYASGGPRAGREQVQGRASSASAAVSAPVSAPVSSLAPADVDVKSTCAIITIVRDEQELLPLWIRYYRRHVPLRDMFILDHLTTDNSTHPSKLPAGINYKVLYGNSFAMPVVFRSWQINKFQDRLLRFGYPCVIFGDTDELIVPNPKKYPQGLSQYLAAFLADSSRRYHRVRALEVGHVSYGNGSKATQEPEFNWDDPRILAQRRTYIPDKAYDKPLLSKVPLRYKAGFHKLFTSDRVSVDEDLNMLHMRSFDVTFCMRREEQKYNLSKLMKPEEIKSGMANHWTTYHRDKQSGELCKFAQASFFGEQGESTQYLDNTGRVKMRTFGDEWKSVLI